MSLNLGKGKKDSAKRVRFSQGNTGSQAQSSKIRGLDFNSSDFADSAAFPVDYSDIEEYNSDDNETLEADLGFGKRRDRRINKDGYGSEDSDQDEINNLSDYSDDEDEIKSDKDRDNGGDGGDGDDDEDMFSDSAEQTSKNGVAKEKKRKRYLDISEIQGQEMDSLSRVEDKHTDLKNGKGKKPEIANTDDDEEEEDKVQIEAFNMKADLEEGQFDSQGNFVWNKKDPQMHQDSWLDGISKKAISQARESKAKKDYQQTANEKSVSLKWDSISNDDIILAIINNLCPGETILGALARIGGPKKKNKKKSGRNKWSKKEKESKDGEKEEGRRREIERLTELADQAMARGMINIYDETFEQFVRQMRLAGKIDDDWVVGSLLATPAMPSTIGKAAEDTEQDDNDKDGDVGLLDDLE
ncbi:hypothetical protein LPJ64_005651 [Coemansia asiatica]|uniref:GYF domain-containing protein n=1 Tax=Coemansia asiatica TaxID=1052880 RepID=A0A9W7XGT3_9FUNG|nr:hypothetical protein LPJ64_005651 [Coemansia asiatica]